MTHIPASLLIARDHMQKLYAQHTPGHLEHEHIAILHVCADILADMLEWMEQDADRSHGPPDTHDQVIDAIHDICLARLSPAQRAAWLADHPESYPEGFDDELDGEQWKLK